MKERIATTEARKELSRLVSRVEFGHERIILQRRERDVVALIPMEELQLFEQMLAGAHDREKEEATRS